MCNSILKIPCGCQQYCSLGVIFPRVADLLKKIERKLAIHFYECIKLKS